MGARYSAPIQTGPGAHPASYTKGTGSIPAVKRLGPGVEHPPTSSTDVKESIELYIYSHSRSLWPVLGQILPFLSFAFLSSKHNITFLNTSTAVHYLNPNSLTISELKHHTENINLNSNLD